VTERLKERLEKAATQVAEKHSKKSREGHRHLKWARNQSQRRGKDGKDHEKSNSAGQRYVKGGEEIRPERTREEKP